jgi:hypothetical protein
VPNYGYHHYYVKGICPSGRACYVAERDDADFKVGKHWIRLHAQASDPKKGVTWYLSGARSIRWQLNALFTETGIRWEIE